MPLTRQNGSGRATRAGIAAATLLGSLMLAACGDGASGESGGGEPAASEPAASSDTSTPTAESEPSVEPATGPPIEVRTTKWTSSLRLPAGYRAGDQDVEMVHSGNDRKAGRGDVFLYAFVNTGYPADTDELSKLWKGRGQFPFGPPARRQPDVVIDGNAALHISGPGKFPGQFVELYQVISSDLAERFLVSFTFTEDESPAERQELIEPVLATWTFSW